MDPITLIEKVAGAAVPVGLALALAGSVLFVLRLMQIDFAKNLDPTIYEIVVVAGIVGACNVVSALLFAAGRWLR